MKLHFSLSDEESEEESGSDELAAVAWQCDKDGMDEKVAGCMDSLDERVSVLEQAVLSGEGESRLISILLLCEMEI